MVKKGAVSLYRLEVEEVLYSSWQSASYLDEVADQMQVYPQIAGLSLEDLFVGMVFRVYKTRMNAVMVEV
jgi:hypothetical protein